MFTDNAFSIFHLSTQVPSMLIDSPKDSCKLPKDSKAQINVCLDMQPSSRLKRLEKSITHSATTAEDLTHSAPRARSNPWRLNSHGQVEMEEVLDSGSRIYLKKRPAIFIVSFDLLQVELLIYPTSLESWDTLLL